MNANDITDIVTKYPYPIAILYRIITALDPAAEPDKSREYILAAAEATARLLGVIALMEWVRLKDEMVAEIPKGIAAEFKKKIKRPSFGIWLGFAREGFEAARKQNQALIVPDCRDLFYEKGLAEPEFKVCMDRLIKLRNAIAHAKVQLDTHDKKVSAATIARGYLDKALLRLNFLKNLSFGYIQTIEVDKKPRQEARFLHRGKKLTGDSIAKGLNLSGIFSDFRETDAVIIRYEDMQYLRLYPFYIYEESAGDAADIFYYNGIEKNRLEYIGIDPGGKFVVENALKETSNDLDAEFDILLGGQPQSVTENVKYAPAIYEEHDHILGRLA